MKYSFKKVKKKFVFYELGNEVLTHNDNILFVPTEKLAYITQQELNNLKNNKIKKFSITSIVFFACNLNLQERKLIINSILSSLTFDNVLYRSMEDNFFSLKMNNLHNKYINDFSKTFDVKLETLYQINLSQKKLNIQKLNSYLTQLDNFKLTLLFKLVNISKSVILSYNFIIKSFGIKKFFNLSNFENIYQKEKWGTVSEQFNVEENISDELKKIQTFFKNL